MLDRLDRAWRVLATGAMISTFAVCVVYAGLVLRPWVRLRLPDEAQRARRMRREIRAVCRMVVGLGQVLGVFRVELEGAARLRGGGKIVVANHPTMLDAVVLLSLLDDGVVVTRRKHWDRPVMRSVVRGAGFPFSEDGTEVVDECVARLEEGASLVLFPEGTRSPGESLHPFQRGAAHIALRSGRELLPVVMSCDPPTFREDAPWYRAPARRFEIRVRVQQPIAVDELLGQSVPRPVAARRLMSQLREVIEKRLGRARA